MINSFLSDTAILCIKITNAKMLIEFTWLTFIVNVQEIEEKMGKTSYRPFPPPPLLHEKCLIRQTFKTVILE